MQSLTFRVVLDTNVVIGAGSAWIDRVIPVAKGNVHRRLLIRVARSHTGLYCGKIVGEYLEKLLDLNHPPERALKLITYLMGAFTQVTIVSTSTPTPPADLDDEVFLLCALDGNADYLVSEDKHLIDVKGSYGKPVIGRSEELAVLLGA
jgi:predicted nucleic acid-binding protein